MTSPRVSPDVDITGPAALRVVFSREHYRLDQLVSTLTLFEDFLLRLASPASGASLSFDVVRVRADSPLEVVVAAATSSQALATAGTAVVFKIMKSVPDLVVSYSKMLTRLQHEKLQRAEGREALARIQYKERQALARQAMKQVTGQDQGLATARKGRRTVPRNPSDVLIEIASAELVSDER